MSEPAIKVEGVGKRYRLGEGHGQPATKLSEGLNAALRGPVRRLLGGGSGDATSEQEEFWALRDISFEIGRGDMFGLIGRNGAGKSTLLKLLAQISPPTEGRITVRGRVGTLLEVGTGFHPELTGRENVFLNGAILGMRRAEIAQRYDEIAAFSGIEEFLNTPVKRYSSGMYVRLAFAVAAHLEPEVLLLDEVLAVGDAEFQRKSFDKIMDVAQEGRTVVFVSHNLAAVQKICTHSAWFDHGRLVGIGPTQEVVSSYLAEVGSKQSGGVAEVGDDVHRIGVGGAKLVRVELRDSQGQAMDRVNLGEPFSLTLTFEVDQTIPDATIEVGISSADGTRVVTSLSSDDGNRVSLSPGTREVAVDLELTLLPGDYWFDVGIHNPEVSLDFVERVLSFVSTKEPHEDVEPYPWPITRGVVRPASQWAVRALARTAVN
ncbi:MAG: ABC transporter ATP-binding protein [Solirubrobacterales bacterium]